MEDNKIKLCKDCKWCDITDWDAEKIDLADDYSYARCVNPKGGYSLTEFTNLVTGEVRVVESKEQHCLGLRADKTDIFCGQSGLWFEPKEKLK